MPSAFCGEANLFGIRVAIRSNHPEALQTALSALLKGNNPTTQSSSQSVTVTLVAGETNPAAAARFQVTGMRLQIIEDGIALEADGEQGSGTCWFDAAVAASKGLEDAVKTTALFLVAQAGRIPVHASAVIVAGRALVLAGKSGSGKSSLAMAACRRGMPVLSEDTVFVQTEPSFCVWGSGGAIHLLEKDAPPSTGGTRFRSGRLKRAIPIALHQRRAHDAILCVLEHGDHVTLEELDREKGVRTLTAAAEPGYEFYGSRMENAIRAVARKGCWRLVLSNNTDAAVGALIDAFSNRGA